jgi:hypothetical protein
MIYTPVFDAGAALCGTIIRHGGKRAETQYVSGFFAPRGCRHDCSTFPV